jgi:outer membrane immunogenic protein
MKLVNKSSIFAILATGILASGAYAADLGSTKDGPSIFSDTKSPALWTGFYAGIHGGYGWGDATTTGREDDWGKDPKYVGPHNYEPEGWLAGGTVGYNRQLGIMVFGVEGDIGYMSLDDGDGYIPSSNPKYHQDLTIEDGLYGVLAGRVGVSLGQALIYGKAGWAYFDGASSQKTTKPGYVTNESDAFTGWAYGGGLEYALGGGWTMKAEYLRFDFGNQGGDQTSVTDAPIGHVYEYDTDLTVDTVKIGVNRRF